MRHLVIAALVMASATVLAEAPNQSSVLRKAAELGFTEGSQPNSVSIPSGVINWLRTIEVAQTPLPMDLPSRTEATGIAQYLIKVAADD